MEPMPTDRRPIGLRIKRARERKRMTQDKLASLVGVSQKTVDNWENDRSYPRSAIGALEEILGPLAEPAASAPPTAHQLYPDFVAGDPGYRAIWDIPDELLPLIDKEFAIKNIELRRLREIARAQEAQGRGGGAGQVAGTSA